MAILPQPFPVPPPAAIATYDFVDISEATGVVIFYATNFSTSAGITFGLLSNPQRSVTTFTNPPDGTTTTYNFDLAPFNLPKTVKGTAHFSAKIEAGGEEAIHLLVQLKKWDGSNETNITSEIQSIVSTGAVAKRIFFKMPTTQTHFKKGEILRLTVKAVTNTGTIMYHDPINSSGADPTETMRIDVPFRLDDIA